MRTFFNIYVIISSIVGTLTILWFILSIIVLIIRYHRYKKATKQQMEEFKEAISKSGMGQDLNKPLTKEEKKILKEKGHLEFKETLDMETLNVTKEMKIDE